MEQPAQTVKIPLTLRFRKSGDMVYYSQLDLCHVLERALRRAELPLYFTQGFRPHVKISFGNALKLGLEGEFTAILYFARSVTPAVVAQKLSEQLPVGLTICGIAEQTKQAA